MNSPTPFVSGTKVPPPGEKNDNDVEDAASEQVPYYASDPDVGFATSDFPEVPKESLPSKYSDEESYSDNLKAELEEMLQEKSESKDIKPPNTSVGEDKQFLPFISRQLPSSTSLPPAPLSCTSFERKRNPPPSVSRTNTDDDVDLLDVSATCQIY
ncbi:hypothetical protein ACET3Z_031503 [Daucus carota]